MEGDCDGCGARERTDESLGGGGGGAIRSGHLGRGKGEGAGGETEKQQTDALGEDSRKKKVLFNLDSHLATPEVFSSVDAALLHLQAVLDDGGHIFLVHELN